MAVLLDDASSEYLLYNGAVVSNVPTTMACWFNSDVTNAAQVLVEISDDATWHGHGIGLSTLAKINTLTRNGLFSSSGAVTTTTFSANTWHHACGVFAAADDRRSYLDGGSKGTNSTSKVIANLDTTTIGSVEWNSTVYWYLSGMVAEAAIWNVALTDAEVAVLAKGYSPLFVRPQNLVAYWDEIRSDNDKVGGFNMTPINAPAVAAHPAVIYPATPNIITAPAAAGGRTTKNTDAWYHGQRYGESFRI